MKIKLDENLPTSLARRLAIRGHDVETVFDEALSGENDDRMTTTRSAREETS